MASMPQAKTIIIYHEPGGNEPFTEWLNRLRDPVTRRRIVQRLLRVESGHYGDFKALGDGINELRFFFGAGYRVYFGEDGDKLVILLCGGDKDSQSRDIQQAQRYWQEYLTHV
ncbi:MAG: type II toxin-antitoxin system RelE/ParE family toxin [Caldilineaceae bacterium]